MNKYPIQIGGIDIADSSENVKIIWNYVEYNFIKNTY